MNGVCVCAERERERVCVLIVWWRMRQIRAMENDETLSERVPPPPVQKKTADLNCILWHWARLVDNASYQK